ncbi:cytochrome c [Nisaea sp.]|uniref:cytochrome c n=1 Tax=Nisaea sp. TaxID=2024842 RepID=UPI0032F08B02
MMLRLLAIALTGLAAFAIPAQAGEGTLAAKGREIALTHCARCHVINAETRLGGIGSTPSFSLLLSLADAEHRFDTFFARRPHPAFIRVEGVAPPTPLPPNAAEIRLTVDDLDALLVFVQSLKQQPD